MLINLSNGLVAQVDDSDANLVSGFNWRAVKKPPARSMYVTAVHKGKKVSLHRLILGLTDPKIKTDHINGDGLDNRRCNLRPCTQSQNMANTTLIKSNSSGYKGVHKRQKGNYVFWRAEITCNGKHMVLGIRKDKMAAVQLYDDAAIKLFGDFAKTNLPQKQDFKKTVE